MTSSYQGYGSYTGCVLPPNIIKLPVSTGNSSCDAALQTYIDAVNSNAAIQASNQTQLCLYNQALDNWAHQTGDYNAVGDYFYLDGRNGQTQVSCQSGNPEDNVNADAACKTAAFQRGSKAYASDWSCTRGTHVDYAFQGTDINSGQYTNYADCTGRYYCGVCTQSSTSAYQASRPIPPTLQPVADVSATVSCCDQPVTLTNVNATTINSIMTTCSFTGASSGTETTSTSTNKGTLFDNAINAFMYLRDMISQNVLLTGLILVVLIVLIVGV